jgi:hypothetical protein
MGWDGMVGSEVMWVECDRFRAKREERDRGLIFLYLDCYMLVSNFMSKLSNSQLKKTNKSLMNIFFLSSPLPPSLPPCRSILGRLVQLLRQEVIT